MFALYESVCVSRDQRKASLETVNNMARYEPGDSWKQLREIEVLRTLNLHVYKLSFWQHYFVVIYRGLQEEVNGVKELSKRCYQLSGRCLSFVGRLLCASVSANL